jgi:hypothetical protein
VYWLVYNPQHLRLERMWNLFELRLAFWLTYLPFPWFSVVFQTM